MALLTISSSCVPNQGRVYAQFPPKSNYKEVQIIHAKPVRDYTLIADFEAINVSFDWIQRKAAQYGADAVFVASFYGSSIQGNADLNNTTKSLGINNNYFCTAIKYK